MVEVIDLYPLMSGIKSLIPGSNIALTLWSLPKGVALLLLYRENNDSKKGYSLELKE
jgi:hypothetical protein